MKKTVLAICFSSLALTGCATLETAKTNWTDPRASVIAGVKVKLESCSRTENEVQCFLTLTSMGQDRKAQLDGNASKTSILIDNKGNQYSPTYNRVGNSVRSDGYTVRHNLVADVTTEVEQRFSNIHSQATKISRLSVDIYVSGKNVKSGNGTATFRNVELSP